MTTSRARVPNELWLEIFDGLPKATLTSISLVHRDFSRISRSLLFAEFSFHPYALGANGSLLLPPTAEVERALERLRFWYSEEIAPLVRFCSITPWQKLGPVRSAWTFSPTDTPYILLDEFFQRLGCFSGLRRLDALAVEFTQTGVANLLRLPALDNLRAVECNVTAEAPDQSTQARLRLTAFSNTTSGQGMKSWIPLLSPDHLQQLEMLGDRWLLDTPLSVPIFPRVSKLEMSLRSPETPRAFVVVLVKFPALQTLSISVGAIAGEGGEPAEVARLLPSLREYNGPCSGVHLFLACPALTRLKISFCSPARFISELQISHTITALEVNFDDLDIATLNTICAFLPRLTELCADIVLDLSEQEFDGDDNYEAVEFFDSLPDAALPPTLRHLAITWAFECDEDSPRDPNNPPEYEDVLSGLVERCPDLTSLWLDGSDFAFRWRKARDGTVDQETAEDLYDAETMRNGFSAFWEAR